MKNTSPIVVLALPVGLALAALSGNPARAIDTGPSFDCKKATTPVEKAICRDSFTSFRDGALGKLYSGLMANLPRRAGAALRREQLAWLRARERTCGKVGDGALADCLNTLYDKRLRQLDQRMRRAGLGPGGRGLVPVAGGYTKRITNFTGYVTVVEMPKGPAWVEIFTIAGPTAHFCTLGTGQARRTGATLTWRDTDEPKCSVSLTFKGRTVRAKATDACRLYCGARGYFQGITYSKTGR